METIEELSCRQKQTNFTNKFNQGRKSELDISRNTNKLATTSRKKQN